MFSSSLNIGITSETDGCVFMDRRCFSLAGDPLHGKELDGQAPGVRPASAGTNELADRMLDLRRAGPGAAAAGRVRRAAARISTVLAGAPLSDTVTVFDGEGAAGGRAPGDDLYRPARLAGEDPDRRVRRPASASGRPGGSAPRRRRRARSGSGGRAAPGSARPPGSGCGSACGRRRCPASGRSPPPARALPSASSQVCVPGRRAARAKPASTGARSNPPEQEVGVRGHVLAAPGSTDFGRMFRSAQRAAGDGRRDAIRVRIDEHRAGVDDAPIALRAAGGRARPPPAPGEPARQRPALPPRRRRRRRAPTGRA